MKASDLLYQLDRAIQEQGDCEMFVTMETEDTDNYNPLTTFDLRIVAEAGGINLVAENGTRVPKVEHKARSDASPQRFEF